MWQHVLHVSAHLVYIFILCLMIACEKAETCSTLENKRQCLKKIVVTGGPSVRFRFSLLITPKCGSP
jgi:hypothetical protein